MTSQQDALYRAVCEYPDEDTPRLIFADRVEESGDGLLGGTDPRRKSNWPACRNTHPLLEPVPRHDPNAILGLSLELSVAELAGRVKLFGTV